MSDLPNLPAQSDPQKARNLLLITYVLFGLSLINGLTAIAAVIIAHLKVGEAADTFIESHYRWLIRTFWIALIGAVIGGLLMFIFIGMFVLVAVFLWYVFRLVKGFLAFNDGKPIADPQAWI